jgi:ribosomal protein S18 acetylase RimI-like enzyme
MFRVTQPESPAHFASIFELRYRILRKPWNQPKGSERDDAEATSIHAMILDENGVCIATGRLQFNSNETGQIRFMAVDPEHRGKHLGKKILQFLEEESRKNFRANIFLQARENAVEFYRSNGYTVEEKTFLLFDQIQHYRMVKWLK